MQRLRRSPADCDWACEGGFFYLDGIEIAAQFEILRCVPKTPKRRFYKTVCYFGILLHAVALLVVNSYAKDLDRNRPNPAGSVQRQVEAHNAEAGLRVLRSLKPIIAIDIVKASFSLLHQSVN